MVVRSALVVGAAGWWRVLGSPSLVVMLLSISSRSSQALLLTTLVALATPAAAQQPLPLKYKGPMTTPAISAGDLMTRLYVYADDSMMGRVGTVGPSPRSSG